MTAELNLTGNSSLWFMEVNSLYTESSYLSYRMNEQDSDHHPENASTSVSGSNFIKQDSKQLSSIFCSISINKEYRNLFITRMRMDIQTTTKWVIVIEPLFHLIFPWLNESRTPSDYDSDSFALRILILWRWLQQRR